MGIFSGKTKIHVSSVAYNIAGDANERNNFLKESLIYLNAAEQSIGEKLPRMYLQSLGIKLKRAYKYAASLPQGLPTASTQLWEYQDFEDEVQSMLDTEHGVGRFKVEDSYITTGNTASAIEKYLNQTYGWDSVTGLMANPPAGFASNVDVTWVYAPPQGGVNNDSPNVSRSYAIEFRHLEATVLPDLVVNVSLNTAETFSDSLLVVMVSEWVTSTRSDSTVTRAFLAGDVSGTTSSDTVTTTGSRETTTTTTVITVTDGTTTSIRTRVVDASFSEKTSREYVLGTGAWPALDTLWSNRADVEQTYFPSIPFRVDNKDMLDDSLADTEQYKGTQKLCKLMGMDALTVRDQINENESVNDIDFAFMVAGANMNTESQAEMDYLFRFWDLCVGRQLEGSQAATATWRGIPINIRGKPKTNSLMIEDPESKNGAYKIYIEWDYIEKVVVEGVVAEGAKIGQLAIVKGATDTQDFTATNTRSLVDNTIVSIRRQISETQYEELQISGAIHKNEVYAGKMVETLAKDAREAPEDHEGFIIPLHMGIFSAMPLTKRTQLAQECIYLVFNCYVKVKQKWYQSGIFKIILAIIGIIIIVISWGTATPAVVGAWVAMFGVYAAIAYMAFHFLVGYMISYLMGKWAAGFASVFGKKWAGVVMAVIQIVVSAYSGGGTSGAQTWLQTAVQIIDIATQLFSAYAKGVMITRQEDFDAFMDRAEADQKLLDKLSSEFFGEGDLVSIDYLLQLQKTLREDNPTTFLTRTLMTGSDVVDITLGQVSEMVYMNTTPRLQGIFL